jgi:hypothetical protein
MSAMAEQYAYETSPPERHPGYVVVPPATAHHHRARQGSPDVGV